MDILILFCGKYPGFGAAAKRVQNYQKGLNEIGNKVDILPVYPFISSQISGILAIFLFPYYTISKLINYKGKYEVLFVYGFGWISKLLLILFTKSKSIKIVFEVNEKPYSIIGSRRDYILKYFYALNNWFLTRIVYKGADGFVVISENLKLFVSKYITNKCKVIKIPIIVDFEKYQDIIKGEGGIKPYIFHSATLNDNKDGISDVFEALALAIKKLGHPIHFYLTSKLALSSTKARVDSILKAYKINEYVHFLGDLDENTLLLYQQNCDLVIINKVVSEQNLYNFATKIGEYSALGKPIITTEIGEVSNYFKDNVNCLFVPQNNTQAIADKIVYLILNPDKFADIGAEAKKTASTEFDLKSNCRKLNVFFETILRK